MWYIAGFDVEYNRVASDGTTYDNGYGIMLLYENYYNYCKWGDTNIISNGYINSYINKTVLPGLNNVLKPILGDHFINRNVLLSNSNNDYGSTNYIWTTSYSTLMSVGQMTGNFAQNNNKYDDGEANYKLPLFNFMNYYVNERIWTRNIYGNDRGNYRAWIYNDYNNQIESFYIINSAGVRPLIYIR